MSELLIPRFETKKMGKNVKIITEHERSVKVIDHATDNVVMVVNYAKTSKENMEIAELFITALENYIKSDENEG